MAILNVWERWQDESADVDESGVRTLGRSWGVDSDAPLSGPAAIDAVVAFDATAGLYMPHPAWPWSVCRGLGARPDKSRNQKIVTAKYSSAPFGASGDGSADGGGDTPGNGQSNSTPADQRPPTIAITRKEVTKVHEFDCVTTDRFLNSVGDPFDPPLELFRSHHIITWKFYRTPDALNWGYRSQWLDSVNLDPVNVLGMVYPPYSLRCVDYAPESVWETGEAGLTLFYVITVQAEYDPATWRIKVLNTGRRRKITVLGVGVAVQIVDEHGQPVPDPVPLTDTGVPVTPGGPYYYVTGDGYFRYNWTGSDGTLFGPGGICE